MLARLCMPLVLMTAHLGHAAVGPVCPSAAHPVSWCEVAQQAIPACVYLKITLEPGHGEGTQASSEDPYGLFGEDLFDRYFGLRRQQPPSRETHAGGSGCIVSADGYIMTNHHVIKDAKSIVAILNNGREYPAKVIGSDAYSDIAIVKIEGKNLPFLQFGDSDKVMIGEPVAAIGAPFELEASLTAGVVSATGRHNLRINGFDDFIQTDAAVNPGNSGGPLLNLRGEIIGIADAILTRGNGFMGISLAVPSNMARHVMEQVIHHGTVTRGYLGIYMQPLDTNLSEALGLGEHTGALVSDLSPGSPAARAGLEQGDVIVAFDGHQVDNIGAFRSRIALTKPGTEMDLTVIRNGEEIHLQVTIAAHTSASIPADLLESLGLELRDLTPKELGGCPSGGVVIQRVQPGSKGAKAGLRPGMVIQQVQRQPVHSVQEIMDVLSHLDEHNRSVLIVASNGRQSMLFALRVD